MELKNLPDCLTPHQHRWRMKMDRIVIELTDQGEIKKVYTDSECRVFILDRNCTAEPVYEFTEGVGKETGVKAVREALGDNLAADFDSTGPWLNTNPLAKG